MLGWVEYPERGGCFVYPQYMNKGGEWVKIPPSVFPNNGSFKGIISGNGYTMSALEKIFGKFVIVRLNASYLDQDQFYDETKQDSNKYCSFINPALKENESHLEFKRFSSNALSDRLVQIVDVAETAKQLCKEPNGIIHFTKQIDLYTKTIIVHCNDTDEDTFFGPFKYEMVSEYSARISTVETNDYHAARIKFDIANCLSIHDNYSIHQLSFVENSLVQNLFINAKDKDIVDWMPNDALISALVQIVNSSSYLKDQSNNDKRNLKNAIRNANDTIDRYHIDDLRKERIIKLIEQTENWAELPEVISTNILNNLSDDDLSKIVLNNNNIDNVKDRVINFDEIRRLNENTNAELKKEIQAKQSKLSALEEEVAAKNKEKEEAEKQTKRAKTEAEQIRNEVLAQKREEIKQLDSEIETKTQENFFQKRRNDELNQEKRNLEQEINKIISNMGNDVAMSSEILKSELLRKVITAVNGIDLAEEDNSNQAPVVYDLHKDESKLSDKELIDEIYNAITEQAGRHLTKNDVINLMICLTQGYITTFSGLPGTGKTSLANILAGALGLTNDDADKQRFTEINVENGWTSYKDYIGYYNPLGKIYEQSNITVYNAMKKLSQEASNAKDTPPYLFLLDEANLSPIEHYWAPFLRACDDFEDEGTLLALGGKENWILPNQIRFIATVNFDHTTEALSHRFLDRSWIISLEPEFLNTDEPIVNASKKLKNSPSFSFNRLKTTFGEKEHTAKSSDNLMLLNELLKICQENGLPVSPRSQKMMQQYIETASLLMDTESKDNNYDPLDYAFSQKVLPQISGPKESMEKLIEKLIEKCGSLSATSRQLKKMKAFGEDNEFYQYFI